MLPCPPSEGRALSPAPCPSTPPPLLTTSPGLQLPVSHLLLFVAGCAQGNARLLVAQSLNGLSVPVTSRSEEKLDRAGGTGRPPCPQAAAGREEHPLGMLLAAGVQSGRAADQLSEAMTSLSLSVPTCSLQ